MTTSTVTSFGALTCSATLPASPRLRGLVPVQSSTGVGHAARSHKPFAMAGIDANIWPLGPQEWTSG